MISREPVHFRSQRTGSRATANPKLREATSLEKSRVSEAVVAYASRVSGGGANDHMIHQLDVEGACRLPELACDLHICARRGRVTQERTKQSTPAMSPPFSVSSSTFAKSFSIESRASEVGSVRIP